MLDVEKVVLQSLERNLDACAVRVADLRPAGQAGPHAVAQSVERNGRAQLADEFRPLRPGTDEAHYTAQDIPELRQLVEPRPPEDAADTRHAVVVRSRPDRASA